MRPRSFTACFSLLLLCVSARTGADNGAQGDPIDEIALSAKNIGYDPKTGRFVCKGEVALTAGELKIDAASLYLDLKSGSAVLLKPVFPYRNGVLLTGARLAVDFETNSFKIEYPKIRILIPGYFPITATGSSTACREGACEIENARATACPHEPAGYYLRADKILLRQNGDFDFLRPVLEVNGKDTAAVPWIRLRTGNVSGFLPPRLGWDSKGGFVAGPAGRIPLGKTAFAQGHVAVRTAQGLESRSALHTRNLDLSVDHLFDIPDNLFRFGSKARLPLNGASLNADVDVVSDRQIIDDLAANPLDRSLTHTTSRGLLTTGSENFFVETYAELLQSFDIEEQISREALTPKATIELGFLQTPVAAFFWPAASVKFTRFGMSSQDRLPDASGLTAPGHSRLEASYGFSAPGRAGPVAVEMAVAGRHQAWLTDSADESDYAAHLASADALFALPLAKRYGTFRHKIDPYFRYRITPWIDGGFPPWAIDDFDKLRRGQGMEAGIATALDGVSHTPIFNIKLWERIDLPGFGANAGFAYVAGSAAAGPSWFTLSLDGSLDHENNTPSSAGLGFKSRHGNSSIELGGRWIGPGRGPHLDQPFSSAAGPWLSSGWPQFRGEQMEIFQDMKVALTGRLTANTGVRLGVWPDRALHALWYGLELRSSCGCLAAQIVASHRPDAPVPDVMTVFTIRGI